MHRRILSSSSIPSVGYDKATRVLEIEFWQGEQYRYLEVPCPVHQGLLAARSPGDYFNQNIRDAFESERIDLRH